MLRRLLGLIYAGGLLLLVLWGLQQEETIRDAALPYAVYFCFGILGAAALLSWYHDYSRVLCATVVVGLGVWAFGRLGPASDVAKLATAFLLPLNLGLFAKLEERGMSTLEGLFKVALIGVQVLAIGWIAGAGSGLVDPLLRSGQLAFRWTWMPLSVQLSFGFAAFLLLGLFVFRRTNLEAGLLWALAAVFVGLNEVETPGALYFYCGGAGLVLMFAVLEHGYDIAYRDDLTGLPGRRAFNEVLQKLRKGYTIVMCDVDHFKNFNDTYGHDRGDLVLKSVASTLSQVQSGGRAFRYGGEEFALIFKHRSASDVQPVIDSLRDAIAHMSLSLSEPAHSNGQEPADKKSVNITISIGLADHSRKRPTARAVLEAADAALYVAKESGRNCVKVAEDR